MQNKRKHTLFRLWFFSSSFFIHVFFVYFSEFCASVFDFKAFAKKNGFLSFYQIFLFLYLFLSLGSLAIVRITFDFLFEIRIWCYCRESVVSFSLSIFLRLLHRLLFVLFIIYFILWNLDIITIETGTTIHNQMKHSLFDRTAGISLSVRGALFFTHVLHVCF